MGTSVKRTEIADEDPTIIAKAFVRAGYMKLGQLSLRYWNQDWWEWKDGAYHILNTEELENRVWRFLNTLSTKKKDKHGVLQVVNIKARIALKRETMAALRAIAGVFVAAEESNVWLSGEGVDPGELVPLRDGLLDVGTRTLLPATPEFFNVVASEVAFNPETEEPKRWLQFLDETFGDDNESKAVLAEIFGYCLTGDLSQQKIFTVIGAPRSGKGTIVRTLSKLLGEKNVASIALHSIGSSHGLESLTRASLAVAPDAGSTGGSRDARRKTTEILKKISGEDAVNINPKGKSEYSTRLKTRLLIVSNEIPEFADPSNVIPKRLLLLKTAGSVYGHEDLELPEKLDKELSGILNWALDGLDRLRERGKFVQPESGKATIELLEDAANPIASFLRDYCTIGDGEQVEASDLYGAYLKWGEEHGFHYQQDQSQFGRNLLTDTRLTKSRIRIDGRRTYVYHGINLNEDGRELLEPDDDGTGWARTPPLTEDEVPF